MKIAAFSANAAFLPALAKAWLAAGGDASEGVLILPTRRAARALAGAFLDSNGGNAMLLPRIIAYGAVDEAGLSLEGGLEIPPAVPVMIRQAELSKLILALKGRNGAPSKLHSAWALAAELAALLDEAEEAEIDLRETLPGVVGGELAAHWQSTLTFLEIITHAWPEYLAARGMVNPAQRLRLMIDSQNAAWAKTPPHEKIWLVTRDASPAMSRLSRRVAKLTQGAVILPGYDAGMSQLAWEALDESHAQAGIARLLGAMGARREEIERWGEISDALGVARTALVSRALLPAGALAQWQEDSPLNTDGLYRLTARDEQEDATAIAMVLRAALEVPGRSAALVTPDRSQARRVAAACKRFGIIADDSAGEALADTPPAILLRLLARAAASQFTAVPLLALLKHPLAALGLPSEICRAQARALERAALRGPRLAAGLEGIRFRLVQNGKPAEMDFLTRLETRLRMIAGLPKMLNPADALRLLIEAGENLAASETEPGTARLWENEAGGALAERLTEALLALADLPDIYSADLADFLDAMLAGQVLRRPRAKDGHPRIAIWGVQEASLQTVDVAVLGGLVEGVWPAVAEPGPWLSRPMRKSIGLPAAEQQTGLAAHDFFGLCCRCETVVLAAPARRERAPVVPARWITRLEALLAGGGRALTPHPAQFWAAQLDMPAIREGRPKPEPRPPAVSRPRVMSISDITTLIADPYAIYARKILKIRELDELDAESDVTMFGNIVHAGLAAFYAGEMDFEAAEASACLSLQFEIAMREQRPRPALQSWWQARLTRIAGWIVQTERERRREFGNPSVIGLEIAGELSVAQGFTLKGRADRIERREDGGICIIDYKTGTLPDNKDLQAGTKPQLPLEAMMAEAGGFGLDFAGDVTELAFWKLAGRSVKGEASALLQKPGELRAVIENAKLSLPALLTRFADESTPYLAAPHPERGTYKDIYRGVSRRGEWDGASGDEGDEPA